MKFVSRVVSFSLFSLVAGSAIAADLPEPVIEHVPVIPAASSSGWYLRGDIGYKIYKAPKTTYSDSIIFEGEEQDPTGIIGAGVGYRFNEHLRTDVTVDYEWPSDFDGRVDCLTNCGTGPGIAQSVETASLDVWTILWNVYADLGNYRGFTPYVGAGIGASYVSYDDIRYVNPNGAEGGYPSDGKWNFSWAAMAGVGYAITPSWHLDAGYRYLWIGDGKSANFSSNGVNDHIKYEDLAAHEFRVGLRYEFGQENAFAPGPVVATY
ncbi:porin family protein [Pseudovibrio exalbescens]|uniref:outer membrane protein n=1 Tax=Pseudovibrio exalbescens TaxID=197461 RepID=UPI002365A736|nr:outer membrane protein [Pseudovibrio exalbescens]MDD7911924.1 porin family protein [Pseudovibrio exalbescens]